MDAEYSKINDMDVNKKQCTIKVAVIRKGKEKKYKNGSSSGTRMLLIFVDEE
ncbi:hypothetical protein CCACVL1_28759, partial [Corchorus capsularis]